MGCGKNYKMYEERYSIFFCIFASYCSDGKRSSNATKTNYQTAHKILLTLQFYSFFLFSMLFRFFLKHYSTPFMCWNGKGWGNLCSIFMKGHACNSRNCQLLFTHFSPFMTPSNIQSKHQLSRNFFSSLLVYIFVLKFFHHHQKKKAAAKREKITLKSLTDDFFELWRIK